MQLSTNHHPRPRLIILLLLVAGVVSVLYFLYNSSFNPAPVLLEVSILCLPFLVAMEGFYVVSGRVRKRRLPLVLAFGIAATITSAIFNTTLSTVGPCALGVVGSGSHYHGILPSRITRDLTGLRAASVPISPHTGAPSPLSRFFSTRSSMQVLLCQEMKSTRGSKGVDCRAKGVSLRVPRKTPRKRLGVHDDVNVDRR